MAEHGAERLQTSEDGGALPSSSSPLLPSAVDPLAEYLPFGRPSFGDEEVAAVTRVLREAWTGMGPETLAFERELADYTESPHVVSVNSCTSALFLSLHAHGIGPGCEVLCPSLTWYSTANVVLQLGAQPVFCDVDRSTLCVTPESLAARVTDKTRAALVVHYGGFAVDVDAIRAALGDGIVIVEDAAHALGSRYPNGKPVGSSGNETCFSFYSNKNLATADGGAIATFDDERASRMRTLRLNGVRSDAWQRFTHKNSISVPPMAELGFKMNFSDLLAAIGRVQLRRQAEFAAIRLEIAKTYRATLTERFGTRVAMQTGVVEDSHARHLFAVQLPIESMKITRNEFLRLLREKNVGACIHYSPLHRMLVYKHDGQPLPDTEFVCERNLTLPISASMTVKDTGQVIDVISRTLELR